MAFGKSAGKWRRTEVLLFGAPLLVLACFFGWFFVSKALLPPPPPMILRGHTDIVYRCAFSSDSKTLVTASRDKTVNIWGTGTGILKRTLKGHHGEVKTVAVSPDGRYVLSGCDWFMGPGGVEVAGGELNLWDMNSGSLLWSQAHTSWRDGVKRVAFSPDGKLFAKALAAGPIHICDVETGNVVRRLPGSYGMSSLLFSPNGGLLATDDKLWDLATGHSLRKVGWPDETFAFSPDSKDFAIGRRGGIIDVQDSRTGRLIHKLTLPTQGSNGGAVIAFSSRGNLLSFMDNSVTIWDLKAGAQEREIVSNARSGGYKGEFSPNCKIFAGSSGNEIVLWHFLK